MVDYLAHESAFRGDKIVANRARKSICLFGVGALGSWLLDLLARQGYTQLTCVDFDKVETANFGTQLYGKTDVGRAKATQAAHNVMHRLGVKTVAVSKKVTASNVRAMVRGFDLVVDLFDNGESRELLRSECDKQKIHCLHAGMGTMGFFEVVWNESYTVAQVAESAEPAPCDYPLASNLVMLCVGVTAEVINRFIDDGEKINTEFWLKHLKFTPR